MLYQIYGDEHPEIAQTLGNVASFLMETGEYDRAEGMIREELDLNIKLLGPEHWRVADSYLGLAGIALENDEPDEARQLALTALDIYRQALPAGHLKISGGESVLGDVYLAQGRYAEAEPLLLESYRAMEAVQDRVPYRIAALETLIDLYEAWGKPEKAVEYGERLEALEAEARGPS